MPVNNRGLHIVGGLMTLIFGSLYLSFWFLSVLYLGIQPWMGDFFLFFLEAFFGIIFIAGLVVVLVGLIAKDYPAVIIIGGSLTIAFGIAVACFSPGLTLPWINPELWYSWVFMLFVIVGAILNMVGGYQHLSLTPKHVAKTLHST